MFGKVAQLEVRKRDGGEYYVYHPGLAPSIIRVEGSPASLELLFDKVEGIIHLKKLLKGKRLDLSMIEMNDENSDVISKMFQLLSFLEEL